jgi:hypothetical protein
MSLLPIPATPDGLTPEFLTQVVQTLHAGVIVDAFDLVEHKTYGEIMVSTSDRLRLRLTYSGDVPDSLPTQVSVKLKRSIDAVLGELYDNEVQFYLRLRNEQPAVTPYPVGAVCDKETALFYLLLEDLSLKNAKFPNATSATTVDQVKAVLDQMARLHAFYWNSPRLTGDLAWYQNHVDSSLAQRMRRTLHTTISSDMPHNPYKRERVAMLGTTVKELGGLYVRLEDHQATLTQTILHGDGHIGNSYLLPDGTAGLLDFQLTARGYWAHDVNYLIVTALDVEQRRASEAELVRHYLEQLRANGVTSSPSWDEAWLEYRRGILWSFYVGWLTTPITNYGEAINRANLFRISEAFADHETLRLAKALP